MNTTFLNEQKNEIISLIKEWRDTFYDYAEKSRKEELESLKTYDVNRTVPGVIYSDKWKDLFTEETDKSKIKLDTIFSNIFKETEKDITIAPKTEAFNAVTAFKLRNIKNIPKREKQIELQMLLNKYGDNYLINRAINDIAKEERIFLNNSYRFPDFIETEKLKELVYSLFKNWDRIQGTIPPDGYINIILNAVNDFDFEQDSNKGITLFGDLFKDTESSNAEVLDNGINVDMPNIEDATVIWN